MAKERGIPLNIHLLVDNEVDFLRAKWTSDQYIETRRPAEDFPFPCRLLIKRPELTPARWAEFVQQGFEVDQHLMENQSAGALLLLKAAERQFAVSFGYGANAIERKLLEPDFGLRVALNLLSEDGIAGVDAATAEKNSLQSQKRRASGTRLAGFGVDLDQDWVRAVHGRSDATTALGGETIRGGDTVKLTYRGPLAELDQLCAQLLTVSGGDDYLRKFPGIENRRLVKDRPRLDRLDAELQRLFDTRSDALALAFPELPHSEATCWRFRASRQSAFFDDLHINLLYAFAETVPEAGRLADFRVSACNPDQKELQHESLAACLIAEIQLDGQHFLCLGGRWFSFTSDFIAEVEEVIGTVNDVTDILTLPDFGSGQAEGNYNGKVGDARRWVKLDADLAHFPGRQKVECCDLAFNGSEITTSTEALAEGPVLLAVKKASSSAALSHLFTQGTVAIELFRTSDVFRSKLNDAFRRFGRHLADGRPLVVYCIATDKPGPLSKSLFLFSKIALKKAVRDLQIANVDVAICRIGAVISPTQRAKKRK